jgi:hypothetical protein
LEQGERSFLVTNLAPLLIEAAQEPGGYLGHFRHVPGSVNFIALVLIAEIDVLSKGDVRNEPSVP